MAKTREQALFGAAVLKLTFAIKKMQHLPGFRVVYMGTLKEFQLTDEEVNQYILAHRDELDAHIRDRDKSPEEPTP
ncbi:MAG: hypothetical protein GX146_04300 [Myxococcales bacterium]|jgi:hypothetical protein|nr:hypothetical protein [Myxococcales bacterium]